MQRGTPRQLARKRTEVLSRQLQPPMLRRHSKRFEVDAQCARSPDGLSASTRSLTLASRVLGVQDLHPRDASLEVEMM